MRQDIYLKDRLSSDTVTSLIQDFKPACRKKDQPLEAIKASLAAGAEMLQSQAAEAGHCVLERPDSLANDPKKSSDGPHCPADFRTAMDSSAVLNTPNGGIHADQSQALYKHSSSLLTPLEEESLPLDRRKALHILKDWQAESDHGRGTERRGQDGLTIAEPNGPECFSSAAPGYSLFTASGKPIALDPCSLKAAKLFADLEKDGLDSRDVPTSKLPKPGAAVPGFQLTTASGRAVQIGAAALKRGQQFMSQLMSDEPGHSSKVPKLAFEIPRCASSAAIEKLSCHATVDFNRLDRPASVTGTPAKLENSDASHSPIPAALALTEGKCSAESLACKE